MGQLPIAAQALLGRARVRQDDARAAARQRPLPDQERRSRPLDHLRARQRLLGGRPAGQQGPLQLRRDPLRVLPRPERGARGVQGRAATTCGSRTARASGPPATQGPALEKGLIVKEEIPTESGSGHAGLRLQHPPAGVPGPARPPGPGLRLRLRVDQQDPVLRALHRAPRATSPDTRAGVLGPAGARASWRCSSRCKDKLPPEVFTKTYEPPDDRRLGQHPRQPARGASALFKEAGYEVKGGKLVNTATGQPLAFEILLEQGGLFERVVGPFVKNLERLGVQATVRDGRRRAVPEPAATTSTST